MPSKACSLGLGWRASLLPRLARLITLLVSWRTEKFFDRVKAGVLEPETHLERITSLETGVYALYIHIPFCREPLCRFCCFIRYPYRASAHREYMKALRREAEWVASKAEAVRVKTVYIGGGTPTIDVYSLVELIDHIRSLYGKDLQVSVEASPADINDETVSMLRSVSIDRLSIGVQSLEDWRLRMLGRLSHRVEDSLRAVETARGKFKTLNIDMLWGSRCDTIDVVRREARRALELGADQVTFYPLMPAPGQRVSAKQAREGPYHPLDLHFYTVIVSEALSHGYQPATPWCMSRERSLVDEYIVDYDKFLAIGLSSIARLGSYVYVNTFSLKRYSRLVAERGFSAVRGVDVSSSEDMLYYLSTTLFGLNYHPGRLLERYGLKALIPAHLTTLALQLLGEKPGRNHRLERLETLYVLHRMQQAIYMGVNSLREWGIKNQV